MTTIGLRHLHISTQSLAVLAADPGAVVVVPVGTARTGRLQVCGSVVRYLPQLAAAVADVVARLDVTEIELPFLCADRHALVWPVAPATHDAHSGHRCEIAPTPSCWHACERRVLAAAPFVPDLLAGSGAHLVSPPLLAQPPVPEPARQRLAASFAKSLHTALGDAAPTAVFSPSLFHHPRT